MTKHRVRPKHNRLVCYMTVENSFFELAVGKPVSHIWRGAGSAISIELGELSPRTRKDGSQGEPDGDITLMIEWSWRLSDSRAILAGSWSEEDDWDKHLKDLVGSTVESVNLFGALPEIAMSLSCGKRVESFMIADGDPAWALIARKPNLGSLCVESGLLVIEELKDNTIRAVTPKSPS